MTEIKNLKPECVWRNFHALTQVPRPSGHRDKIQQFLLDFAAKAGVEAFKDEAGNIVMRKPATPGMENRINHFHLSNLSLFMNFFISGSALMHSRLAFTR